MKKFALIPVIAFIFLLSTQSINVNKITAAVTSPFHPAKKIETSAGTNGKKITPSVKGAPAEKQKKQETKPKPAVAPKPAEPAIPDSIILNVPLINQMDSPQLYNGCEVTSLAMVLNYHGVNVTKNALADQISKVPLHYDNGENGNPNVGFVGDMVYGPGLGVYNGPIYTLAKSYVGDKAVNLTNSSFDEILKNVGQGLPVWVITTADFIPVSDFQQWNTPQGMMQVSYSEHSVVITGYDPNYIYINNPYGNKNEKVDRTGFKEAWQQMGSQAVVIKN